MTLLSLVVGAVAGYFLRPRIDSLLTKKAD